jgi:diaminopimelate epimerase
MDTLSFDKYEGLGNDFILVEASLLSSTDEVRTLCDRHRGIGADGVLLTGLDHGRPFMRVINADGSTAEMCGNGLRCVALYLVRRGVVEERSFEIDTDAGPHPVRVIDDGSTGWVEVSMRAPSFSTGDVPVVADSPMIDFELFEGFRGTAVSMGNPHFVTFAAQDSERLSLATRVQADARFPESVNVGFAEMNGASHMALHVYERGVGFTRACGTGACAAVAAAIETGRATRGVPLEVKLPGGALEITVRDPGERVLMKGPARQVFSGKIAL